MRRGIRPQYLFRMRIKSDYNWSPVSRLSVFGGSRDNRLMAEVHAIENADGEKELARQPR